MPKEAEKKEEKQRCEINIRSVAGPSYQIFMLNNSGMRLHVSHLAPSVGECWIFSCKEVTRCAVFCPVGTLCPLQSVTVFKTGLQLCSPHSLHCLRHRRRYFKCSGQLLFTCTSCFVPVSPKLALRKRIYWTRLRDPRHQSP